MHARQSRDRTLPRVVYAKRLGRVAGYTLLEILVVVSILVLITAISVVSLQNFNRAASLKSASQEVRSALIDSRNKTLASFNDSVYGIHIGVNEVVQFEGVSYSGADPNNASTTFGGGVRATTSLSGGATEIVFERLTGIPSATGTISLKAEGSSTTTVTVYETGLIE